MGTEDDKIDKSIPEVSESNPNRGNKHSKLPSCTIVLKQFLSNIANGQVYNPSVLFNPKIKIYIDDTYLYETNLFFDLQQQVKDVQNDLIFNNQIDFVIPSFRSVLTFELYDHPMVSTVQYNINGPGTFDSHIFISAVKVNAGYFIPGKFYNLILQFTGNLNPIVYDIGDLLTNIKPNEVSCSQCKVCMLFNRLTTNKSTDYYKHNITSDNIVESTPVEMSITTLDKFCNCNCVKYSEVNESNPCSTCIIPCCSHKYNNYVSVAIKLNTHILESYKLLKSPQLMKPVPEKSDIRMIDYFLYLSREGRLMYSKINQVLDKTININLYTFLQIFLATIFLFPFNIMSLIMVYIGILFIIFSFSIEHLSDQTEDYMSSCSKCLNVDTTFKKYNEVYIKTNCLKCMNLEKYSELNALKTVILIGSGSLKDYIINNVKPIIALLLGLIEILNVFILISQTHGKILGLICFYLAFLFARMKILRITLYYIIVVSTFLTYSKVKINFIDSILSWIRNDIYFIMFIFNKREFNNRIHWVK